MGWKRKHEPKQSVRKNHLITFLAHIQFIIVLKSEHF